MKKLFEKEHKEFRSIGIRLDSEGYQPSRVGLMLLLSLVVFLFCLFALRFWYLQVHRGEEFAQKARDNRLREEQTYGLRGIIKDTQGNDLAENRPAFALTLTREDCPDIPATLAQVSHWLHIPLTDLEQKYRQDVRKSKEFEPMILQADMSFTEVARVEAEIIRWPGLQIVTRTKRTYPYKDAFAHILGYVAEANERDLQNDDYLALGDNVGKQGLEFVFEKSLRGEKGLNSIEVNVLGQAMSERRLIEPSDGTDLHLTLDAELQEAIVDILGDKTGSVIVMDPFNGALKALVTTPAYDNNLFVQGLSQKTWSALRDSPYFPLQNRAIQSVYPPGSVWKLLMVGLFLESGITPDEEVYCSGATKLGTQTFRCWRRGGHGWVDMEKSLTDSCDIYYYLMGEKLGIDKIEAFALASGFGKLTGIDLPHEKTGLVPSKAWKRRRFDEPWYRGETLNASIGQGHVLTSPLQITTFVSALLNGGTLLKPRLLHSDPVTERGTLPMSAATRAFILDAMIKTATKGTAKVLARSDMVLGGKTGTAQVVRIKMIGNRRLKTEEMAYFERDHAWIATWGDKDGQTLVVTVMIEHGGGGSSTAGPIARQIYEKIFGAQPIIADSTPENRGISNASTH